MSAEGCVGEEGEAQPSRLFELGAAQGLPLGAMLAGCGLVGAAAVALLHLDRLPLGMCLFKRITGLPCLSCGATRSVGHLSRLDLPAALSTNPLATLLILVILGWGLLDVALLWRGRSFRLNLSSAQARLARVTALALLAANWLYLIVSGI